MRDVVIVTAAGDSFFEWVLSLVASLRDLRLVPRIPFAVVDVGLRPQQKQMLMHAGISVVNPKLPHWWHASPTDNPGAASLLTRQHYPEMFRHAQIILHVDADIWIATPAVIEDAIAAARSATVDIAAALHDHPSYRADKVTVRWRAEMRRHYAREPARLTPVLASEYVNAGLFAASARSPVWQAWQDVFSRWALKPGNRHIHDQAALNVAIEEAGLRLHRLDPTCNWLLHLALPAIEPRTGHLVEPVAPFRPISAIHVAGKDKLQVHSLQALGCGGFDTSLDRKSFIRARDRWLRQAR